jgi:hypothetical protein
MYRYGISGMSEDQVARSCTGKVSDWVHFSHADTPDAISCTNYYDPVSIHDTATTLPAFALSFKDDDHPIYAAFDRK